MQNKNKVTFQEDDRVILKAIKGHEIKENRKDQIGTFLNYSYCDPKSKTCCIELDKKFREDRHDDGIREVEVSGLRLLK